MYVVGFNLSLHSLILGMLTTPMSQFPTGQQQRSPVPPSSPSATQAELTFSGHYPIAYPLFFSAQLEEHQSSTSHRGSCHQGVSSSPFFANVSIHQGVRIILHLGWGDLAHCNLCCQEQGVAMHFSHICHSLIIIREVSILTL